MYNLINKKLENFSQEYNLLYWRHIVQNNPFDSSSFRKRASSFFHDKEINSFIENNLKQSKDIYTKRKFWLLKNYFKSQRIALDNELSDLIDEATNLIKDYKYSLNGELLTDRQVREKIARAQNSSERQKYLKLYRQLHEDCKNLTVEIVSLRNKLSRKEGVRDFLSLYFSNYNVSIPDVVEFVNLLKKRLIKVAREKKYSNESLHQRKGDLVNILSGDNALQQLNKLLRKWGINIKKTGIIIVNDTSCSTDFPWNLCVPVMIPDDIRVFIFPDKPHISFYYTLFHEIGHALHYSHIRESDFIFKLNPPWYEESMASLVDKFLSLNECIETFTKNPEKIKLVKELNQSEDYRSYLNRLTEFIFESEVYGSALSISEIDRIYKEVYKENLGIENKELDWGYFLIQNSLYPFYGISYVIANTIANQIITYVYKKYGKYLTPEVFSFIKKNLYTHGNSIPWQERIEKAISQPFTSSYFWGIENVD